LANGREDNLVIMGMYEREIPARSIIGVIPVSKGGTGRGAVSPRGVLYGSLDGSTIESTSAGTLGQVLVNYGASDSNAVPT